MTTTDPLRVLAVCTGNVCRSPLVERLLQAGFTEICSGSVEVRSAGTHALVGAPAERGSRAIASALGASLDGFSARQLTTPMLVEADLVLALTSEHRSVILELAPAAFRKTFTLREFARLVGEGGAALPASGAGDGAWTADHDAASVRDTWRAVVARAAQAHHAEPDDDITDPFGQGPEVYRKMAAELVPAVDAILTAAVSLRRRKHAGSP
jgi:protein-tyrosine phosphatase